MPEQDSPIIYTTECLKQVVPAVLIGLVIDKVLKKVQDKYEVKPLVMSIVQIMVLILVLYAIEMMFRKFAYHWQETTPGLLFAGFVFGVQFNLFENLKAATS